MFFGCLPCCGGKCERIPEYFGRLPDVQIGSVTISFTIGAFTTFVPTGPGWAFDTNQRQNANTFQQYSTSVTLSASQSSTSASQTLTTFVSAPDGRRFVVGAYVLAGDFLLVQTFVVHQTGFGQSHTMPQLRVEFGERPCTTIDVENKSTVIHRGSNSMKMRALCPYDYRSGNDSPTVSTDGFSVHSGEREIDTSLVPSNDLYRGFGFSSSYTGTQPGTSLSGHPGSLGWQGHGRFSWSDGSLVSNPNNDGTGFYGPFSMEIQAQINSIFDSQTGHALSLAHFPDEPLVAFPASFFT